MKKALALVFAGLALIVLLVNCCSIGKPSSQWPPENWQPEDYGSFSPDVTYSFDKKYRAVQTVSKPKDNEADHILVTVYDNETDIAVGSFLTQRAFDFWGICWEKDTYNIWIQSADIGTYCMQYVNGTWSPDYDPYRPMPEGIIDHHRMKYGSFQYDKAHSKDSGYIADYDSFDKYLTIRNALTNETILTYPIDHIEGYMGICWDHNDHLWIRSESEVFALRKTGEIWTYDSSLPRPDEVVMAYHWDGTAK